MDKIELLIIVRALFIYDLLEKGWSVRKIKHKKNTFDIYKSITVRE